MLTKSLLAGAGALSLLVAMPNLASALEAVAVTDLNMRAGPGPQYPVVTTIQNNGAVEIMGCLEDSQWCQVNWQGNGGWAYSEYLAVTQGSDRVFVRQAQGILDIPVVAFEGAVGVAGAAVGAAGTVVGATVGAIGSFVGGVAGATVNALTPPDHVHTYVVDHRVDPVLLEGEVVVGATLPDVVELRPVPEYQYHYAYVNGVPVLVEPGTRQIVHVYY